MEWLFNSLSSLAVAGVIGIVGWNLKQRDSISDLRLELLQVQLDMARTYASKVDHNELKASLHELVQEMKSVLEILYEVRADIRAGNVSER